MQLCSYPHLSCGYESLICVRRSEVASEEAIASKLNVSKMCLVNTVVDPTKARISKVAPNMCTKEAA